MVLNNGIKVEIVDHETSEREYDLMQAEKHFPTCRERKEKGLPCCGTPSTCMYGIGAFARPTVCRLGLS